MAGELAGKVAIVTGGARGIGRGTVELFIEEGAKVVIADLNDEAGEAFAAELGAAARYKRTDVSKPDEVQALIDFAVAEFGRLDVMFNNAGISQGTHISILDDDFADFDAVMRVNLLGVMAGTQRAARHMAAHGGGSIINNASIGGMLAGFGVMTYRASKAAVLHFSKCAAIDLAQHGIRVNTVCPGHVRTPMSAYADGMAPEVAARIKAATDPVWDKNQPLKRTGAPRDVGQAALFFASDRSVQITGTVMAIDGGITAGDPVNHLQELMAARAGALAG